jgi:hypothetical protein
MPVDSQIALSGKIPDGMAALSSLVNTAQGIQDYKNAQLQNQIAQQQLQQQEIETQVKTQANGERKNVLDLMQNDNDFKPNPDGTFNINQSTLGKLQQIAPQTWSTYAQQAVSHNQGVAISNKSLIDLGQDNAKIVGQAISALPENSTPVETAVYLDGIKKQFPGSSPFIDEYMDKLGKVSEQAKMQNLPDNAIKAATGHINNFFKQRAMSVAEQQNYNTPSLQGVNTGQTQEFFNVKPGIQDIPQGVSIASFQNELPPTTPVFNKETNTPGYLGANKLSSPIQSAPSLGAVTAAETQPVITRSDWENTVSSGSKAQQNIGVLQNIKQYAPGAVTGVVADRRAFLTGLAGLVGIDPANMEKTNTDLLAKNSNMLALAGGNTDLARTLAEVANPNVHMTKEAIAHAADQVIAQQKMALVKQQFMQPYVNDPQAYSKKLTEFNKIADPRILQYPNMSIKEKTALKANMTKDERESFKNGLSTMESMGFIK